MSGKAGDYSTKIGCATESTGKCTVAIDRINGEKLPARSHRRSGLESSGELETAISEAGHFDARWTIDRGQIGYGANSWRERILAPCWPHPARSLPVAGRIKDRKAWRIRMVPRRCLTLPPLHQPGHLSPSLRRCRKSLHLPGILRLIESVHAGLRDKLHQCVQQMRAGCLLIQHIKE